MRHDAWLAVPYVCQAEEGGEECRGICGHPVHGTRQLCDQTAGAEPGDLRGGRAAVEFGVALGLPWRT